MLLLTRIKSAALSSQLVKVDKLLIYITSAILLVLAAVFYKERTTFSDTAAYVSHIMARDKFEIGVVSRYVSIIPEFLPYCAFKIGLPLKYILLLYSLSFTLIPVSLSLVALNKFKETYTSWSILIFYTLMSMNLFFYPVSEYQIGLFFLLFYMGYLANLEKSFKIDWRFVIISIVFIPTIIFSHPLSGLAFATLMILYLVFKGVNIGQLVIILSTSIISTIVRKLFFDVEYDQKKLDQIDNFKKFDSEDLFQELGKTFNKLLIQDYFLIIVLSILTLLFLLNSRKIGAALIYIISIVAWWLLVTVSFKNEVYDHYYEHMYQAIPLIVSFGFCQLLLRSANFRWQIVLTSTILVISLGKIYSRSQFYTERISWFENCFALMNKIKCKKAIFTTEYTLPSQGRVSFWSIPYETLLLSSLDGNQQSKTIYVTGNLENIDKGMNLVTDIDEMDDYPLVPSRYFIVEKGKYCIPEHYISKEEIKKITFPTKDKH